MRSYWRRSDATERRYSQQGHQAKSYIYQSFSQHQPSHCYFLCSWPTPCQSCNVSHPQPSAARMLAYRARKGGIIVECRLHIEELQQLTGRRLQSWKQKCLRRGRATGDASYIPLISLSCSGLSIYPALHPYHLITVYFPDNHLCQQIEGRMSSRLSEEQLYITRISDS